MRIRLRKAKKEDLPAVLELIKELAAFERALREVTVTLKDLERDGFGKNPLFEVILAENGDGPLGMAFYYVSYSTWKGKCVYLEDIIVRERHRSRGIGKLLLEAVIKRAKKLRAKRVQWQVLRWNKRAIKFYKKLGADTDPAWLNCRLTENKIGKYPLKGGKSLSM